MGNDVTYRKKPNGGKRRKHLDETPLDGAMAERRHADGRRRIKLTNDERALFARNEIIERAVALFLDVQVDHSWDEIAQELGMSVMALKDLTKTEAFIETYNQHFAELGHDPRLKSVQAAIVDLLPLAVRRLKDLISSAEVPASVTFRAIEKVIELNGIGPTKGGAMDRNELMEFLKGAGLQASSINLTQNNITAAAPAPYDQNISAYVEGRWNDIQAHQAGTIAGSIMDNPGQDNDDGSTDPQFPAQESAS